MVPDKKNGTLEDPSKIAPGQGLSIHLVCQEHISPGICCLLYCDASSKERIVGLNIQSLKDDMPSLLTFLHAESSLLEYLTEEGTCDYYWSSVQKKKAPHLPTWHCLLLLLSSRDLSVALRPSSPSFGFLHIGWRPQSRFTYTSQAFLVARTPHVF